MNDEPDFDWSQAASLLSDDPGIVPEDMAALLVELCESATRRLEELRRMNPATDETAIAALAHQLRGSLLNFGFTGVGTVLVEIERHNYTVENYSAQVDKASVVFAASKQLLAGRYPTLLLP
jgi:HPt (histidine-containing phosphotransfer) domain-containing protein